MSFKFQRPVGAAADVKELEYICALHQTDPTKIRQDGSIYAIDISNFLCSRYGIKVSEEEVRKTILKGFGGGDEDDECIDLTELVAILMIPFLLKASNTSSYRSSNGESREYKEHLRESQKQLLMPPSEIVGDVLEMMLSDVTGSSTPKKLDKYLIKDILLAYGEKEMAADEKLVEDMLYQACGSNKSRSLRFGSKNMVLNKETFTNALTRDVQDYEVGNEIKLTNYFYDVFETSNASGLEYENKNINNSFDTDSSTDIDVEALDKINNKPKSIFTAPSIDDVVGSYSSKSLVTFLWASFIITYFAYFHDAQQTSQEREYCSSQANNEFACLVANGIVNWLIILVQLCVLGLMYMGLGSIGNSLDNYTSKLLILGMVSVFCFTYIPFHITQTQQSVIIDGTKVENNTAVGMMAESFNHFGDLGYQAANHDQLLFYMAMCLGCLTLLMQLRLLIGTLIEILTSKTSCGNMKTNKWVEAIFTPGCILAEAKLKKSVQTKINGIVKNAHDVHKLSSASSSSNTNNNNNKYKERTSYGRALLDFDKLGKKTETVGGFMWTWKEIFSGDIFSKEGIWFSARLHAGNLSQFLISIFILFFGLAFTHQCVMNHDIYSNELMFTQKAIQISEKHHIMTADDLIDTTIHSMNETLNERYDGYNCSLYLGRCNPLKENFSPERCIDFNISAKCAFLEYGLEQTAIENSPLNQALEQAVTTSVSNFIYKTLYSYYPQEKWMVSIPMNVATYVAFLVGMYLTLVYIPSVTTTILQLRSGFIPSLRNSNFHKVKNNQDRMTMLLGSMFWGTLFAGMAIGTIAGGVVFVFLWPVTRPTCLHYLGQMIGLLVTITIKFLIFKVLRNKLYTSLYRKQPAASNVVSLILECCNIGLSAGFVVVRAVKLVLVAIMYVGRIDTPILYPGVGKILSWEPDTYPTVIRKDILAHEAHRHPYIELLGGMYLMKLRHGSNFAKTAGSCWRILFVFALMPWLRKYRVMARPALVPDKNDQSADDCDDDGTIFFDTNATIATNTALYRNYSRKAPGMEQHGDSNNKNTGIIIKKVKRSSSGSGGKKERKENVGRERSVSDSDLRNANGNKKKNYQFEC